MASCIKILYGFKSLEALFICLANKKIAHIFNTFLFLSFSISFYRKYNVENALGFYFSENVFISLFTCYVNLAWQLYFLEI